MGLTFLGSINWAKSGMTWTKGSLIESLPSSAIKAHTRGFRSWNGRASITVSGHAISGAWSALFVELLSVRTSTLACLACTCHGHCLQHPYVSVYGSVICLVPDFMQHVDVQIGRSSRAVENVLRLAGRLRRVLYITACIRQRTYSASSCCFPVSTCFCTSLPSLYSVRRPAGPIIEPPST